MIGGAVRSTGETISLSLLVSELISLGVPPRERLPGRAPRTRPTCPNRACALFGLEGPNIRGYGRWKGYLEHFCLECGARFLPHRIIMCFDDDHGCDDLHPTFVAKAQSRLRLWKKRLSQACAAMLDAGEPISVKSSFQRARIPLTWNLRSRRLGLVAIVETYVCAQAERLEESVSPESPVRKDGSRVRRGCGDI
jgi:hypothetical protein